MALLEHEEGVEGSSKYNGDPGEFSTQFIEILEKGFALSSALIILFACIQRAPCTMATPVAGSNNAASIDDTKFGIIISWRLHSS